MGRSCTASAEVRKRVLRGVVDWRKGMMPESATAESATKERRVAMKTSWVAVDMEAIAVEGEEQAGEVLEGGR